MANNKPVKTTVKTIVISCYVCKEELENEDGWLRRNGREKPGCVIPTGGAVPCFGHDLRYSIRGPQTECGCRRGVFGGVAMAAQAFTGV
jgi:hypothetical protein